MSCLKMLSFLYGSLLLLTFLSLVPATPLEHAVQLRNNEFRTRAQGFYLRIMPLGASITRGDPSDPGLEGRGYRKFLRDNLRSKGWKVNMVGSQRWGKNFVDNVRCLRF
jgi:hypothetical protein